MLDACAARSHPRLRDLDDVTLASYLRGSFAFLEATTGTHVRVELPVRV